MLIVPSGQMLAVCHISTITGRIVKYGWRIPLAANLLVEIFKRNNRWVFKIVDWADDYDNEDWFDFDRFSDCIDWTNKQLELHPRAARMAYDEWYFERKRDLEAFQTLWTLQWA